MSCPQVSSSYQVCPVFLPRGGGMRSLVPSACLVNQSLDTFFCYWFQNTELLRP